MELDRKFKVSVVTAVYNVEAYLGEMIESIIAQTIGFKNVQLILVDDGSKDQSGEICDQYAKQYPDNIMVVHKVNGGVSSARNEGLKYIKGEYVNFTDADDMLEDNALQLMYEYMEENGEWIDLCAIRLLLFGAGSGEHPLNYRFKKGSRIVDLQEEYDSIQLAINSVLVKRDCFINRRFEEELVYAEDAQVVVDILLDKMHYGIVCGTSYLYRKREAVDSAIDLCGGRACYYITTIRKFTLYSIENAKQRKGYVPRFVQYTCMYDLQWRLKKHPLVNIGVLTENEEEEYRILLLKVLQDIDNSIIVEQKNINTSYKMAILFLKEENRSKKKFIASENTLRVGIDNVLSIDASDYFLILEFIEFSPKDIVIEGYVKYLTEFEDIEVVLKGEHEGVFFEEYVAALSPRKEKYTFCMDHVITQAKGFKFCIGQEQLPNYLDLKLYLRYHGRDILCRNISFGKFFPLARQMKSSYLYHAGLLLTYSGNTMKISREINKKTAKECEKRYQNELLTSRDKRIRRACIARKIYHALKHVKKKEIWLISDRLTKADDNGEAFFTYMNANGKNARIDTYFVLNKDSEDYERLQRIGKVVCYHSVKHKILSLLCDKIISSQGDEYVFNRFFDLAYLYKDIRYLQKIVFLQHGVTQNDLSGWLSRSDKNISLFVTSTHKEYRSILEYSYNYDKKQVKCTGMPRYDYLYDSTSTGSKVAFMPTWRKYLAGNFNLNTDSRMLKEDFVNSAYCRMYQQVFSDQRLYEAAKKYDYTIKLMLHPAMPRECVEYFSCDKCVEILEKNTRYKEIYADSKLLITDYSSAVFDFAYLRKPVLYYQQDINEFYSGGHICGKGYFNYEKDGFGEVEYTAEALVDRIVEYMQNGCRLKDIYRDRIERTFRYNDKNNCKRVYEEIVKL